MPWLTLPFSWTRIRCSSVSNSIIDNTLNAYLRNVQVCCECVCLCFRHSHLRFAEFEAKSFNVYRITDTAAPHMEFVDACFNVSANLFVSSVKCEAAARRFCLALGQVADCGYVRFALRRLCPFKSRTLCRELYECSHNRGDCITPILEYCRRDEAVHDPGCVVVCPPGQNLTECKQQICAANTRTGFNYVHFVMGNERYCHGIQYAPPGECFVPPNLRVVSYCDGSRAFFVVTSEPLMCPSLKARSRPFGTACCARRFCIDMVHAGMKGEEYDGYGPGQMRPHVHE